jgi:septum formation protein
METILLASSSPRRFELLRRAGIAFEALAPAIDEQSRDDQPPSGRVVALAEDKARAAAALASPNAPRLVLAADTLVCLPGLGDAELVLGKPASRVEAASMMRHLAGRSHVVRTGMALLDRLSGRMTSSRSDSIVSFAPMSDLEIEAYLDSREWEGVAGAYRIQGRASFYIERLEGSWTGVVGLPMHELYVILSDAGYRVPTQA